VTLSGFAGGEYLPLPASKGLAFPSLLTLEGCPISPADYAQGQRYSFVKHVIYVESMGYNNTPYEISETPVS